MCVVSTYNSLFVRVICLYIANVDNNVTIKHQSFFPLSLFSILNKLKVVSFNNLRCSKRVFVTPEFVICHLKEQARKLMGKLLKKYIKTLIVFIIGIPAIETAVCVGVWHRYYGSAQQYVHFYFKY
jgi:hypothetical protein